MANISHEAPRVQTVQEEVATASAETVALPRLKVLVVDDNPRTHQVLQEVLTSQQPEGQDWAVQPEDITLATSSREAIVLLQKNHYQVVILDSLLDTVSEEDPRTHATVKEEVTDSCISVLETIKSLSSKPQVVLLSPSLVNQEIFLDKKSIKKWVRDRGLTGLRYQIEQFKKQNPHIKLAEVSKSQPGWYNQPIRTALQTAVDRYQAAEQRRIQKLAESAQVSVHGPNLPQSNQETA